ncbi:hypothetical protein H310_12499 [Aphanomyces invadans]|uniref:Uncharacterized protein n=1 Tax=Aphanomyces invadans TaxID=157072 RepID=A0A024TH30_9STRA|nr:hypothetical protein H310_12499 [Aphanomyces invadans]ETV93445.1 hypothetical protein H310_12499 [Aphanomyces invadans]RHY21153.1 hypothetical protein DYB32_009880 [Aphanomyces invadans]|eukprot:XP_008877787.1 hypothetical protein H310_12499 [Aphanomyces invadans]
MADLALLHMPELRMLIFSFQRGVPYALTLPMCMGGTSMPVGKAWSLFQTLTQASSSVRTANTIRTKPSNADAGKEVTWAIALLAHLDTHQAHNIADHLAFVDLYAHRWPRMFTQLVLDGLAETGKVAILAHLYSTYRVICSAKALKRAAQFGHLSVLEYVHAHQIYDEWSVHVLDKAAASGHLNIVQFLHSHRPEGGTTAAMDLAALGGHFDVLVFLHHARTEGCTTNAIRNAAKEGHLDIVKFLSAHRVEGCTKEALNMAAAAGYLDIVHWLVQHRTEGNVEEAMVYAARHGHVDVVKFLHVNGRCRRTKSPSSSKILVDVAAANGHLDVVRFIHDVAGHELPPWGWCSAHVKALVTPRRKNGVVTGFF